MSPNRPYRLNLSGAVTQRVRELLRRAVAQGLRDRVIRALQQVQQQLLLNPTAWGDPVYRLHHAELTVYHRIYDGLSIVYGVHDREPAVLLTRIVPVLSHPLNEPEA